MRLRNLARPYYVFRPRQLVTRLWRALRSAPAGSCRVATPWGIEVEVDPAEMIGKALYLNGVHDLPVSEALWRLASPGATAVDVGANIGALTSLLAARVGPAGRVVAMEPHPALRERLHRNVELMGRSGRAARVEVVEAAAGEVAGEAMLVTGADFAWNGGVARLDAGAAEGVRVDVARLDVVVGEAAVDVLKVDVEGHEAAVFRGAARLLGERRARHVVYEELGGAGGPSHAVLEASGYTVLALGWRFDGLVLAPRDEAAVRPEEAPNYVATVHLDELRARLAPRGWRLLCGR